jgi:hypothetical protein
MAALLDNRIDLISDFTLIRERSEVIKCIGHQSDSEWLPRFDHKIVR